MIVKVDRLIQNGHQLSAIVEVVARAGAEIAGNDISEKVLGSGFADDDLSWLVASRIKKVLANNGVEV